MLSVTLNNLFGNEKLLGSYSLKIYTKFLSERISLIAGNKKARVLPEAVLEIPIIFLPAIPAEMPIA